MKNVIVKLYRFLEVLIVDDDDLFGDFNLMNWWWLVKIVTCWLYGCKYLIMQMLVKNIIADDYYVNIYIGELCIVESLLKVHAFIVIWGVWRM